MALTVEDGTGKSDAESYISVVDASTYLANRGMVAWAALASDAVREQCLRKATDYMTGVYRQRWKGYRKTATQALDFPRSWMFLEPFTHGAVGTYPYLVSDIIVPVQVMDACASLALRASTADLAADLDRPTTSETVGSISVSYQAGAPQYVRYREIDLLLSSFLKPVGVTIERA